MANKIRVKIHKSVDETIRKVDGKYVVYPKRGGKRLGTHDTEKDAKKQLAAIEISKAQNEEIELEEKFSEKERAKRRKKCDNPKGFTMKQFCKNQRTRSKKGERKNEEQELEEYIKVFINGLPQPSHTWSYDANLNRINFITIPDGGSLVEVGYYYEPRH